jgi:predicted ATPase with chaperone activity
VNTHYDLPEDDASKELISTSLRLSVLKEEQVPFMYKASRTIACLSGRDVITSNRVAESIQYLMCLTLPVVKLLLF